MGSRRGSAGLPSRQQEALRQQQLGRQQIVQQGKGHTTAGVSQLPDIAGDFAYHMKQVRTRKLLLIC
jgi:hypothetical protein